MLHYSPGEWRSKFEEMTNPDSSQVRITFPPFMTDVDIRGMLGAARITGKEVTGIMSYGDIDANWFEYYEGVLRAYGHGFKYLEVWNEPDKFAIPSSDGYAKLWEMVNQRFSYMRDKFIPAATVNFVQSGRKKLDLNLELMEDIQTGPFPSKVWNVHFYGPEVHKLIWYGWKLRRAAKKYGIERFVVTEFGTGDPDKQAYQINVMLPVLRAILEPELVHWYEFAWDKRFNIKREYL